MNRTICLLSLLSLLALPTGTASPEGCPTVEGVLDGCPSLELPPSRVCAHEVGCVSVAGDASCDALLGEASLASCSVGAVVCQDGEGCFNPCTALSAVASCPALLDDLFCVDPYWVQRWAVNADGSVSPECSHF